MPKPLLRDAFTRLILFFVSGIIAQYYVDLRELYPLLIAASALLIVLSFMPRYRSCYSSRWFFGVGIGICFFLSADYLSRQAWSESEWGISGNHHYIVRILEEPIEKPRSRMYKVCILSADSSIQQEAKNKKAIIYLSKTDTDQELFAGDALHIRASLSPPRPFAEAGFDYPLYLRKQSVACVGFVKAGDWEQVDIPVAWHKKFKYQALAVRRSLLKELRLLISDDKTYALASALMFGYKNELDKETKEQFSRVGAGHILAISGLHFNVIFGVVFYLFSFLNPNPRGRLIRLLIVLPLIWGFAFMTGFSPSVNRAAGMTSIWIIGHTFYYRSFSLNSVSAVAFLMLLIHPLLLFNISFQMSFLAVVAIIILIPYSRVIYSSENKIIQYLWDLIYVSLVAQVGVLPLSIYYFHSLPTLFLLTNILIIPLTSLILCLIPAVLLFSVAFHIRFMLLDKLLGWMLYAVERLNSIPGSSISGLNITLLQTVSLYAAFIIIGMMIGKRRIVWLYLLLILALMNGLYYLC